MSQIYRDIKVRLDEDLKEKLQLLSPRLSDFRILKKSVDARKRHDVHEVYSVEVFKQGETPSPNNFPLEPISYSGPPVIIVGSGPAGLFAAVRLVERGIPVTLIERGSPAQKRILGINQYWRYGKLDPNNNVCFGEGGAGLYSDGKLITRIKSPHIPYVMNRLVQFGAPAEIEYLSNPHVGSDRIRRVIPKLRAYLESKGCQILFDTRVVDLLTEASLGGERVVGVRTNTGQELRSDHVILATGHSANDIFDLLKAKGVRMDGKSFAVGLRIEHPQAWINQIQYRQNHDHEKLGSANYKLTSHDADTGIGVYSFCMCPGGYVLSSGTEDDGVVANGMSNYHRNSPFANAAIVVSVDYESHFGKDVFRGLGWRSELERAAKDAVVEKGGSREIPVQKVEDFMAGRDGDVLPSSTPSGVMATRLDQILPKNLVQSLRKGLKEFDQKLPGFIGPHGLLHGVESRTSCPVRVTRDPETLQSTSHAGLFPAGEGAGYAGGITSAAVDGIKCAEAIVAEVSSRRLPKAKVADSLSI